MDISPLRFGLIGCGENAKKSIVKAVGQTPLAQVVATMDLRQELARDLAQETGAPMYTDSLAEVLSNDQVEAVIISTPHHLHAPQGIQAAQHGKHVLVDKPLAISVEDAQELMAVCSKERVHLGVLFPMRMTELYRVAARLIEEGVLGRVTGFACLRVWAKPSSYWEGGYTGRVQTDWRTRRATSGGGMLMINYSHNLDRLHNLLGLEPQSVYAQHDTFGTSVEVEDYFAVVVRYRGGAIGSLLGSSATPGGVAVEDQIFGTEGTMSLGQGLRFWTTRAIPGFDQDRWNEVSCDARPAGGYQAIIENYSLATKNKESLVVTGESALSSLRVIQAAYQSQQTGAPIVL